jgi:hypothetical protein
MIIGRRVGGLIKSRSEKNLCKNLRSKVLQNEFYDRITGKVSKGLACTTIHRDFYVDVVWYYEDRTWK